MTDAPDTVGIQGNEEIAPFEVEHLRRTMAEAELEDILDELVQVFLEDAPSRMAAIDSAVRAASRDDIKNSAHAYKSAAASMGAWQLSDLLRQLESAGAEGDESRAEALLSKVRIAHDSVVATLQQLVLI
jgi:HPt (histidine-containing phosphotransfer) domain-containing protein